MSSFRTHTTPAEAFWICAICFGWTILGSIDAVFTGFHSGYFSDTSLLGLVFMEVLLTTVALLILHSRHYAVATLYPVPSLKGCGTGLVLYLACWGVCWLAFQAMGAQPEQPVDEMMARSQISLPVIIVLSLVNGVFEEIFLLGFLLRGLQRYGVSIAIGISLLVRMMYHLYQGPVGVISILIFGLALSLYYARTRQLFPVVFAHILADVIPLTFEQGG